MLGGALLGCVLLALTMSDLGSQTTRTIAAISAVVVVVLALTRMWASELRPDRILVNSVCPGWVATEMGGAGMISEEDLNKSVYRDFPIPRVGQPQEVAYVTLFLATDEATYSTGSEFVADGGWFTGMRRSGMPCA